MAHRVISTASIAIMRVGTIRGITGATTGILDTITVGDITVIPGIITAGDTTVIATTGRHTSTAIGIDSSDSYGCKAALRICGLLDM